MQIRRRQPNPPVDISILRYQVNLPGAQPRHILEEIVWHKEKEVEQMRSRLSLLELQKQVREVGPARDFVAALRQGKTQPALIAEVKKASPSRGIICENFNPVQIAQAYEQGGASCLSVLTDAKFFAGSFDNLALVRGAVDLPLLCKEFIIYPYQIYMARAKGADAVLFIAAILSDSDLQYFIKITRAIGMTPLLEVHTLEELDRVLSLKDVTVIGINNRNLEDFSVDLQTTCQLLEHRSQAIKERKITIVSESGLHQYNDLEQVRLAGADAVLIGESLVKQPDPKAAIAKLFSA
ncbi:MAG: indole-3-glycerol phosphate synthase TrpC [Cyanophyceae cyanobacterium]